MLNGENVIPMLIGVDGMKNVVDMSFPAPTGEGATRDITVVTHGPFSAMLEDRSGWALEEHPVSHRELKEGETASLSIDAKSLTEMLPTDENGNPDTSDLKSHQLYGVEIEVHNVLRKPGEQPQASVERFYITRFVSASFPGTNKISLPHTQGAARYTTIVVNSGRSGPRPVSSTSNFIVKPNAAAGWSIEFLPPRESNGAITVGQFTTSLKVTVGPRPHVLQQRIEVSASVVAPRSWFVHQGALARELNEHLSDRLTRGEVDEMVEQVVNNVDQFWSRLGSVPSKTPATADVTVFPTRLPDGVFGNYPDDTSKQPAGWEEEFKSIINNFKPNTVKSEFEFADSLHRLLSFNARERNALVDVRQIVAAIGDGSAEEIAGALETELSLIIAHEIGHANGFVGEVLPHAEHDHTGIAWFDVMQPGWLQGRGPRSSFGESKPYFEIALGLDWEPKDMQDTVDLIRRGPNTERRWFEFTRDSGSQQPEHPLHQNLGNPLDVNNDSYVSPLDALLVINSLTRYEGGVLPEPEGNLTQFVDVDGDGFVSPVDALIVINELPSRSYSTSETTVFWTNLFVAEDDEEQQYDQALSWH